MGILLGVQSNGERGGIWCKWEVYSRAVKTVWFDWNMQYLYGVHFQLYGEQGWDFSVVIEM